MNLYKAQLMGFVNLAPEKAEESSVLAKLQPALDWLAQKDDQFVLGTTKLQEAVRVSLLRLTSQGNKD
jgi:hypothetical protein